MATTSPTDRARRAALSVAVCVALLGACPADDADGTEDGPPDSGDAEPLAGAPTPQRGAQRAEA